MPPIIDSHHHLWDPSLRDYPWMTGPAEVLRRRYDVDDLRTATAGSDVTETVVVQATSSVDETRELLQVSAGRTPVTAVVGWVRLTAPDLADQLAELREHPGRLVGIRHQTHDEPDPDWLTRDDVLAGLRVLRDAGLTFDLLIRAREVPAAVRLAEAVPDLRLVVDHGAKPAIAHGAWDDWLAGLRSLAAHPQVSCKVSGLVTEADPARPTHADTERYARQVIETFGPERAMFGSDWPVCTLAASYGDVLDLATRAAADLTPTERDNVFAGSARRAYELGT